MQCCTSIPIKHFFAHLHWKWYSRYAPWSGICLQWMYTIVETKVSWWPHNRKYCSHFIIICGEVSQRNACELNRPTLGYLLYAEISWLILSLLTTSTMIFATSERTTDEYLSSSELTEFSKPSFRTASGLGLYSVGISTNITYESSTASGPLPH